MILLFTYTGPSKKFNTEHSTLVKIQIDNSFDLGWTKENIILATDFDFEYNGIKSIVLPDTLYYDFDYTSNKIPAISYLISKGIITGNNLYWHHDFDVYQLENFSEKELGLGKNDIGFVPYGYKSEWNLGSIFLKKNSKDIFKLIDDEILYKRKSNNRCDEKALKRLIVQHMINKSRFKELNVTYNLTKRCIAANYQAATKPLKAVHFHPWNKDPMMSDNALNLFMYGKNSLKIPLMNKRLIKIFEKHGVK